MDKWLKYGAAALIVVALVIVGSAWRITLERSLANYQTSYSLSRETVVARETVAAPLTDRVILIVIDGLYHENIRHMPFLAALSEEGTNYALSTRPPFGTKAWYAMLSSGCWPEINGVVSDAFSGQIPTDNLFRRVKEAGLTTTAVAHQWWRDLNGYANFTSDSFFYGSASQEEPLTDQKVYRQALNQIQNSPADLLLINFTGYADTAQIARPLSIEAVKAANAIDRFVEGLAADLAWTHDTLLVVSPDRLISIGNGINLRLNSAANLVDVTTTTAALLGIAPPTEAQGRILWESLTASANNRAALAKHRSQVLSEFVSSYAQALGYHQLVRNSLSEAALLLDEAERFSRTAMYEKAFQKAQGAESTLMEVFEDIRTDMIWRGRWLRLPTILAVLAGLGSALFRLGLRRCILFATGGVIHAALFWLVYLLVFTSLPPSPVTVALTAYLATVLSIGALWGSRQVSRRTGILSQPAQGYWESCTDYYIGIAGIFGWHLLVALWGLLSIGLAVSGYYPDPLSISAVILVLKQALYLLPILLLPIVMAHLDRSVEQGIPSGNGELTLK